MFLYFFTLFTDLLVFCTTFSSFGENQLENLSLFIHFYAYFLLGFRGPRISQSDPTYHEKVPLVLRIKKRYNTLDLISITI